MKRQLTLSLSIALALGASAAFATPGDLDVRFGSNGKQTTSFSPWNDQARDVALQSDGRIVLAGRAGNTEGTEDDFALLRYGTDGNLDTSFGTGGKVTTAFWDAPDDRFDVAESVVVQPDGRIIAAGWTVAPDQSVRFAMARYLANGQLDSSFGVGGRVVTSVRGLSDAIMDIALQRDGKIVVTGESLNPVTGDSDIVTARYHANGTLDASFDLDGVAITPIGPSDDYANGLIIQTDGKIVVAGGSCNSLDCTTVNGNFDFAFARYNTNGSLDASFSDDGKATFASAILIYSDGASRLALQEDGKLVAAGGRDKGVTEMRQLGDFAVMRVLPNGQLDTGFGDRGWVKTPIGLDSSWAMDVAYRPDGKLVVSGAAVFNTVNTSFATVLYNADGSVDYSFGGNGTGIVTTPFGASMAEAWGLKLQPDGGIVLAGMADSGAYRGDFAALRYLGDDVIPDAYGFGAQSGLKPSTVAVSNPVTISGITAPTIINVSDETGKCAGEYNINGGEYTTAWGMVKAGDVVTVRNKSNAAYSGQSCTRLSVGMVRSEFVTTTEGGASGGGGALGLLGLLGLGLPLMAVRRRRA